jgi:hypothetical protein
MTPTDGQIVQAQVALFIAANEQRRLQEAAPLHYWVARFEDFQFQGTLHPTDLQKQCRLICVQGRSSSEAPRPPGSVGLGSPPM